MNSKRSSKERVSHQYNQVPYPLNPIVNQNIDFNMSQGFNIKQLNQLEELKTTNRYLQTQLTLYQEKVIGLEKKNQDQITLNEHQQQEIHNYQFELEQVYMNTQKQFYQQEVSKEELDEKDQNIYQLQIQVSTLQDKITELQNSYQQERLQMKQLLLNKELDNKLLYTEINKIQQAADKKQHLEEKQQIKQLQLEYNEFKITKLKEIEQLQDQINLYQEKLNKCDQIVFEQLEIKYSNTIKDIETLKQQQDQSIKQIQQIQHQLIQSNNQITQLTNDRDKLAKEKQAIEHYYLEQLQKQDNQLQQMAKGNQNSDSKIIIQKLQAQIESKDKLIKEISQQKCNCSLNKQFYKDLESKNTTLILEVERLNSILKQKLFELENNEKEKEKQIDKIRQQQLFESSQLWKKNN